MKFQFLQHYHNAFRSRITRFFPRRMWIELKILFNVTIHSKFYNMNFMTKCNEIINYRWSTEFIPNSDKVNYNVKHSLRIVWRLLHSTGQSHNHYFVKFSSTIVQFHSIWKIHFSSFQRSFYHLLKTVFFFVSF